MRGLQYILEMFYQEVLPKLCFSARVNSLVTIIDTGESSRYIQKAESANSLVCVATGIPFHVGCLCLYGCLEMQCGCVVVKMGAYFCGCTVRE